MANRLSCLINYERESHRLRLPSRVVKKMSQWGVVVAATFLTACSASDADALSLSGSQGAELPFNAVYQQGENLSFDQVLSVRNDSLLPVSIVSWQLALELRPTANATGSLSFSAISPPEDSLFGQEPGPQSDLISSSSQVFAFDMDVDFLGKLILVNEWRNIVNLTITASADAEGSFELVTPVFDPEFPDLGSSWFPFLELFPVAYENSVPSSENGYILLGTIQIDRLTTGPPRPGDFNGDTFVDELDYAKWRNDFGTAVEQPGEGADGSGNSIVDGADYVLWRKHSSISIGTGVAIPEPHALILAALCFVVQVGLRGRRRPLRDWD